MVSTTTSGSGSPSSRFQARRPGTWSAPGLAVRGSATVPGRNRTRNTTAQTSSSVAASGRTGTAQQAQRQEHQQRQEQVRREDLGEGQEPVRAGATGRSTTLSARTPRHATMPSPAARGMDGRDHGVATCRVDSGADRAIGRPAERDRGRRGRRILPCMSDKHQLEAIGPRRGRHRQADPGGDPLVPHAGRPAVRHRAGHRRRRHGCQGGAGRPGHGRSWSAPGSGSGRPSRRRRRRSARPSRPWSPRCCMGHDTPGGLPVGCGLPGIVKNGRLASAANIDPGWVGWPATDNIGAAIGRPVLIVNDADAAGMAELAYGAAAGRDGHGPAADPRHGHRQRPVHRWAPGAQHRVRPPGVPRPGRRDARGRCRARATASWAGRRGPSSSTSTWRASSSTSRPTSSSSAAA